MMGAVKKAETVNVAPDRVTLPDEAPHYLDRFGRRREIAQPGDNEPSGIPEGNPSREWTNAQLDRLAKRDGIDFTGVKNKSDRLTRIAQSQVVADETEIEPALPAD